MDQTGVTQVDLPFAEVCYESAMVFRLPASLENWVYRQRKELALEAPAKFQLVPHLTLLFLGSMKGDILLTLYRTLNKLRPICVPIRVMGVGIFQQAHLIHNLHIRVEKTAALMDLHDKAIVLSQTMGWTPQTPYLGENYLPHISLFDHLQLSSTVPVAVNIADISSEVFSLERLQFFYKPVSIKEN